MNSMQGIEKKKKIIEMFVAHLEFVYLDNGGGPVFPSESMNY